ncbi:MAG TPA: peptidoglycan editing factor PgeF [Mycobacteriales bacterium]|nr:peptidoglycan editing factor PgeF [Mycobacteriales bacterium]HVX69284.1 peptidoglycan editing factor PgeF [Mycobacteriales bacterium]
MAGSLECLEAGLPAGVEGWFTTRAGGRSAVPWATLNLALHVGDDPAAVVANRTAVARRLGGAAVAFPEQVHGAGVRVLTTRPDSTRIADPGAPGVDALVTALPDVAIGVLVADCMPVLLADPVARVAGAAHAGRRGLAAGVLQATLEAMAGLGADPSRIDAVVGPAICGRCYEVPEAMRDEVDTAVPGTACQTRTGTAGLNLVAGALGVLGRAGVRARAAGICTAEDARFYSYRRDGVTGRFAGVVMMTRS